jgi:hypothetical protein
VVCSAFAAELSLKTILAIEGRASTKHDLDTLFALVSPPVRSRVFPVMRLGEDQFTTKLSSCAKAFVQWRYVYEYPAGLQIDYEFIYNAANAFFAIAMGMLDAPTDRMGRARIDAAPPDGT